MRTLRCLVFRYALGQARRAAHLRTALFHGRRRDDADAACRKERRTPSVCCHVEMTDHLRRNTPLMSAVPLQQSVLVIVGSNFVTEILACYMRDGTYLYVNFWNAHTHTVPQKKEGLLQSIVRVSFTSIAALCF